MYARRRPGIRTIDIVLPGSFTEIGSLEQVVAHYRPEVVACVPEEALGFGRKLPEASYWGGESSLAQVRRTFGRARGRLLPQLSTLAPK